jgi:hypothetical protein
MASVTTNYGFDVPTSSDLVKNGATQIALLGQDLDTFLFRPFTKNCVLNSDTSIWQRGTSIASAASVVYSADRWALYRAALATGATVSRQAAALTGFQYSMRIARDSGNTNTEQIVAFQALESSQSIPLAGKTVTFSFYAKAGANLSSSGSVLSATLATGTGTDQSPNTFRFGGWTSQATPLNVSPIITTTWARYSGTVTLGSSITQIGLALGFVPTGTAGANDWVEVTGIQLEIGSQVSPFTTATGTIQGELSAAQRYYVRFPNDTGSVFGFFNNAGYFETTTSGLSFFTLPVEMRAAPSAVDFSSNLYAFNMNATNFTVSTITLNAQTGRKQAIIAAAVTGATTGQPAVMRSNNSTSTYIGFSAEL